MASFITAGNATNGLQVSSDNTGILELRTGTGSGTTAVTVDTSQNVGIGTSSPTSRLHVRSSGSIIRMETTAVRGNGSNYLHFTDPTGDKGYVGYISGSTDDFSIYSALAGNMQFFTGATERARITSTGEILVGTTSNPNGVLLRLNATNSANSGRAIQTVTDTTSTVSAIFFSNPNGNVGSVSVATNSVAYNTTSDYRLKENVQPMQGALATVAQLKPVTYTWKADGSAGQGFIAHELQEVVPDCVAGEKDAVETYIDEEGNEQTRPAYQGIDTSFLVATLTAAIQELNAKVEAQAAEIAALKGNA